MKKFLHIEENEDGTTLMRFCIDAEVIHEFLVPMAITDWLEGIQASIGDDLVDRVVEDMIHIPNGTEMLND